MELHIQKPEMLFSAQCLHKDLWSFLSGQLFEDKFYFVLEFDW